MIFKFHTAFALGLIAMVAGTYLITKMSSENMCCKKFAKLVGWFVVVTAFLGLICSTYHWVSYCKDGGCGRGGYGRGMMMRGRGMMKGSPLMEKLEQQESGPSE